MEKVGEEKHIDEHDAVPFFPHHVLKEGVILCGLLATLITLIVVWPVELGEKANPLVTPEGIKPEWYFLSTYQLLKYFPKTIGLFVSLIPQVLLLIWPFLDRTPERHPKKRPISVTIGVVALLLAIVFGFVGYMSESTITLRGQRYEIDVRGVPHHSETKAAPHSN